jgi:hypothetical protein
MHTALIALAIFGGVCVVALVGWLILFLVQIGRNGWEQ